MNGFDLLLLAFKGIAIASLPIAVIWVGRASKAGGDRLLRLAVVTAFVTFDLIVFGGFTRLTDSGLGCPDWPGCYAKANPFMAAGEIRNAESTMPYGPVSMGKAWIEMIHRYLAMAVGVLIIAMLAISVRRGWALRRDGTGKPAYPALSLALLGLVALQGAFGAWTVTQKLQPIFVSVHLLLGMSLLGMLVWHALLLDAASGTQRERACGVALHGSGMCAFAALALVVLVLQIGLGGWVSANYAVLACTDFPTCQGVWVPQMNFSDGFHLWRELGKAADGSYLSGAALTAIHWTHRSFSAVVFVVLGLLAWSLRATVGLVRPSAVLAALLVAQGMTGLVNVVFAWPLVAAVLHNAGAAALLTTLVMINYRLPGRFQATRLNDAIPSTAVPSRLSKLGRSAG